jgi:hypothetical protein
LEYNRNRGEFENSCDWLLELTEQLDQADGWDRNYTIDYALQYLRDLVVHRQQLKAASWQPSPEINAALQQHHQQLGRKPSKAQLWDVLEVVKHQFYPQPLTLQHLQEWWRRCDAGNLTVAAPPSHRQQQLMRQQQRRLDRRRLAGTFCISDFPDLRGTFVEAADALFKVRHEQPVQEWKQQQDPQELQTFETLDVKIQRQKIARETLWQIKPEDVLQALQDESSQGASQLQQQLHAADTQHMGIHNVQDVFTSWQRMQVCMYSFPLRLEDDPSKRVGLPRPSFLGPRPDAA